MTGSRAQRHLAARNAARGIVERLRGAGYEAFWVGGCVRDELIGRVPEDYDVASDALPEQVEQLFERTIPVGRQFGVVIVLIDGMQFQVATFREESGYVDGRRPTAVRFAHAQADASRRDFTMNGLFFDPIEERLYDWVGGQTDIQNRCIRTIGRPEERFGEDHLRILRAVRFAAELGFQIEPETWSAVQASAPKLASVSAERVRDELKKLFTPGHPHRGLDLLRDSGLLPVVLPELVPTITCDQSPEHHPEGTVYNHIRGMLLLLPEDADPLLAWGVLLHDIAKPATATRDEATGRIRFYGHEKLGETMTREILHRLRFSNAEIETVAECVLYHMQFKDAPGMRSATRRRMALRPHFPLELELHRLDCLGSHGKLDHFDLMRAEFKTVTDSPVLAKPLVGGNDLMAMGLKGGKQLGGILAALRDRQLTGEFESREAALAAARELVKAAQAGDRGERT